MDPLWKSDASSQAWEPVTTRSIGYPRAGDLATGQHPTHIGGEWFEDMLEEIKSTIESAGMTFDPTDVTQFLSAIYALILRPDFVAAPTSGTAPLTVSFTDTSTRGRADTHLWDFGDGHTSTDASPTHTYGGQGTYSVTMTVTLNGAVRSVTKAAIISVAAAPDDSTVFLLHFEGTAGSQTFTDSGIRGLTFTPADTGVTLVADPRAGATSGRFSSSNGISTSWPAGFSMAGPFTIEFSWKPTDLGAKHLLFSSAAGGVNGDRMMIVLFDGGELQWYQGVYGATDTRAPFPDLEVVANAWNDVAITRDAHGVVRAFLNGQVSATTVIDNNDYTHAGAVITVGGLNAPGTNATTFELDEVRLASACLYTDNYPVSLPLAGAPGHEVDPYFSAVGLLMNGDTLTDAAGHTVLTYAGTGSGTPLVNTTDPDFPHGAIDVSPDRGYLGITAFGTELDFGAGDFTIELDYKARAKSSAYPTMLTTYLDGSTYGANIVDHHDLSPGNLAIAGGPEFPIFPFATSIGTLYRMCLQRAGGTLMLFVNGAMVASRADSHHWTVQGAVDIGNDTANSGQCAFDGLIGRIRITKGIARHSPAGYVTNSDLWPTS
ncbi:MAG TPA: LamG-like jellyroll fold domain-containing protein [Burkholderiaceae bacterium]